LGYSKSVDAPPRVELRALNLRVLALSGEIAMHSSHQTALAFDVAYQSNVYPFVLNVLGEFNVSNFLAVLEVFCP
jgi:UDP-N-acetylmuramyl pentapeptide synthase